MKITRFSLFLVASTSMFALLATIGCKKSNNDSSGNGVSATLSGTAFSGNQTVSFYTQSGGFFDIAGFTVKSGDTAALELVVPGSITVNKAFSTDSGYTSIDYITNTTNGKDYDASGGYGSGVLIVTSLDTVGHKIAGTFTGTLYASGSDSLVVTNGKFSTSYLVEP